MRSRRRHDATGRTTGQLLDRHDDDLVKPPPPFGWISLEMYKSPAWQALGINGKRVFERIWIEFLEQGRDPALNGHLKVTNADFQRYGIHSEYILDAVVEAETLGFVERTFRGRQAFGIAPGLSATFRLTVIGTSSPTDRRQATNEWRQHASKKAARDAVRYAQASVALENCARRKPKREPKLREAAE
jgi:hypothetical protein